ncbi:hypothetical protein U5801_00290 [Lamprobacter modestohalophilus]|uniref:hypothetical protein n=1 Tax=Lamprobacter modestohalophilus TaxID=1064514 RepID=UPI001905478C|nr:hypothetical protein [Lamprobacter modestohalophilus]MEA1048262.1 hypothetical protein [Lamprobacter modestohalophilus]
MLASNRQSITSGLGLDQTMPGRISRAVLHLRHGRERRKDRLAELTHHHQLRQRPVEPRAGIRCAFRTQAFGHPIADPAHPPALGERLAFLRHQIAAPGCHLRQWHQLWQMAVEHQSKLARLAHLRPLALELLAHARLRDLGDQIIDRGQCGLLGRMGNWDLHP